jgi:hypothetical protein
MKPRDALGNELQVGDTVAIVSKNQILGKIMKVQDGGFLVSPDTRLETPAMVRIFIDFGAIAGKTGQFFEIVKVVVPNGSKNDTTLM